MRTHLPVVLITVMFAAVVVMGCDIQSDSLTAGLEAEETGVPGADHEVLSKFFTGRDSFGVALKIRTSGEAVLLEDGRCPEVTVVLAGSGNATHLGQIEGELSHCAASEDLSSIFGGEFHLTGATGGRLSGVYPPGVVIEKHGHRGNGDVIETKAEVNGGEVSAVKHEPLVGRGDLHILLKEDGTFVQTFDGWLLHHVVEE